MAYFSCPSPVCGKDDFAKHEMDKTLQYLCLNFIAERFDYFWDCYCHFMQILFPSRHKKIQKLLQAPLRKKKYQIKEQTAQIFVKDFYFLREIYQDLLLHELYSHNSIKEKQGHDEFEVLYGLPQNYIKIDYIPFFIHRSVKKVDLKYFQKFCWNVVKKHLMEASDSITDISFVSSYQKCTISSKPSYISDKRWGRTTLKDLIKNVATCQITGDAIDCNPQPMPYWSWKQFPFFDELGSVLGSLPNLRILNLSNTLCSDKTLAVVAESCPSLISLNISRCKRVTDEGIRNLFDFVNGSEPTFNPKCLLENVNLNETPVSYSGIALLLENMPSLQVLSHVSVPMTIQDLYKKSCKSNASYNLTFLEFSEAPSSVVLDCLNICSRVCPKVKKLNLYCCQSDRSVLNACIQFRNLRSIALSGDTSLDDFLRTKGRHLTSLIANGFSMTPSLLIRSCPNLQTLYLSNITYSRMDYDTVHSLEFLVYFTIAHTDFTHDFTASFLTKILVSCPKLKFLRLIDCASFWPFVGDTLSLQSDVLNRVNLDEKSKEDNFHTLENNHSNWIKSMRVFQFGAETQFYLQHTSPETKPVTGSDQNQMVRVFR